MDSRFSPVLRSHGVFAAVDRRIAERAYEVYSHIYGSEQSFERLNARGGFSASELTELLYVRSYPKTEWRDRFRQVQHQQKS